MTVRFGNNRLVFYVVTFFLSAVVLGLAANFANEFLPHFHPNFIVFSLIVSSAQIFVFLLTLQWATPRTEVITVFIMGILWLAMGAWATDVIGPLQCDGLGGQTTPAKNGVVSAQGFCYEMKVIQAFSWALFSIFVIAFWILLQLISQAERFGRYRIWSEPIRELPWFGEMPGYYNSNTYEAGMAQYPPTSAGPYGYPSQYGAGMPAPAPGHSIIIHPGMNGGPPTISQVPMSAV